jgi:hypothetical protein
MIVAEHNIVEVIEIFLLFSPANASESAIESIASADLFPTAIYRTCLSVGGSAQLCGGAEGILHA